MTNVIASARWRYRRTGNNMYTLETVPVVSCLTFFGPELPQTILQHDRTQIENVRLRASG